MLALDLIHQLTLIEKDVMFANHSNLNKLWFWNFHSILFQIIDRQTTQIKRHKVKARINTTFSLLL